MPTLLFMYIIIILIIYYIQLWTLPGKSLPDHTGGAIELRDTVHLILSMIISFYSFFILLMHHSVLIVLTKFIYFNIM